MAEYCKVCGIPLKASNTVDYRPGSCRDCELERKKLYSGISVDFGTKKLKKKLKKISSKKSSSKTSKKKSKTAKKILLKKLKLKKLKLLKVKKLKAKKLKGLKKLAKIRAEREKKKKQLRQKLEKLRKLRILKALKLKKKRKKEREKERKQRQLLRERIRKAKDRERKLLKKERERLRKEKERLRQIVRENKDKIRAEKRAEKDRIRSEKQRVRFEKQKEKERLKKAKEAAKLALVQAREAARQAAQESRRLKEESKKPPMVSVVTKLKEFQPPPDVKIITASEKNLGSRAPQPTKIIDPKKPTIAGGASLVKSATVIPADANFAQEKEIIKQSTTQQHNEQLQKEVEKLKKDTDPIIDRYNPYQHLSESNTPRPLSPTPWLKPNFSVVKGDFKETRQGEGEAATSGLSDDQVKEIIEKVKNEHKRKST